MTKLASKIATGLAVLALAGPALATTQSTGSANAPANSPQTHKAKAHKKVAQADAKTTDKAASTASKTDAKAQKPAKKSHGQAEKSEKGAAKPEGASAPAPAK